MTATRRGLDTLAQRRPEWTAWLAVLEAALADVASPRWDAMVPEPPPYPSGEPVLSGVSIRVDRAAVQTLFGRLVDVAARGDRPALAIARAALDGEADVEEVFRASICQDAAALSRFAAASRADAAAVLAIAPLLSMPLLHSCRRRWGPAVRDAWTRGYCPICASWPAFAEVRGIERSRYLRCGKCGGEWHALMLRCVYCGTTDHGELSTLVPEREANAVVESCRRCKGYVKAFTRLQGCPPHDVLLEDLDSVELDLSAIEAGFARREGTGTPLNLAVASAAPQGALEWNA
jgi:FdhE protein